MNRKQEPTIETTRLAPVLTDEPVVIPKPRRAVARVAIAYMAAILIVGASAAYIGATVGYDRAAQRTDRRIAVLEEYLRERRDLRDEEKAAADARAQRLREIVCTFADRSQPRDAEVEKIRAEFGCTGDPVPQTTPSSLPVPPAGAGPTGPGQPRQGPTVTRAPTVPQPQPQPPAQPPDPPDEAEPEPDDGGLLCLPLIGCLL